MFISSPPPQTFRSGFFKKRTVLTGNEFQWRYTGLLLLAVVAAGVTAGGASFYFLNQNYEMFINLAYQLAPEILNHLEREQQWINYFMVSMFSFFLAFCMIWGLRLTGRIIYPLLALEKHLKTLTRGEWKIKELKIRDADEFHDLVATYNYFLRSLTKKTQQDLKLLRDLESANLPKEYRRKLDKLIQRNAALVDEEFTNLGALHEISHDQRHVS